MTNEEKRTHVAELFQELQDYSFVLDLNAIPVAEREAVVEYVKQGVSLVARWLKAKAEIPTVTVH